MADIQHVANFLILSSNKALSHREIQKLLYFAQGFSLSQSGESLFDASLDAWQYGPVNTSIWGRFKTFGYNPLCVAGDADVSSLSDAQKSFLATLLVAFSAYGEESLIDMSHTDSPWKVNYVQGVNNPIPQEQMSNYFSMYKSCKDYLETASEKSRFHRLIQERVQYLRMLPNLEEGWISGTSCPPSRHSSKIAVKFLKSFDNKLFAANARPELPKLIMGPVPTGGVTIEIVFPELKCFSTFHNSDLVEFDIERNEEFEEIETDFARFDEEMGVFVDMVA